MFSRREREFLGAVVRGEASGDDTQRELLEAFPNPIYRRKMLWGIRRKVTRATADWALYLRAARVESRVVPGTVPSGLPPLAVEPLVTLGRRVKSFMKPARSSPSARPREAPQTEGRK
jgi:hypothetical protein